MEEGRSYLRKVLCPDSTVDAAVQILEELYCSDLVAPGLLRLAPEQQHIFDQLADAGLARKEGSVEFPLYRITRKGASALEKAVHISDSDITDPVIGKIEVDLDGMDPTSEAAREKVYAAIVESDPLFETRYAGHQIHMHVGSGNYVIDDGLISGTNALLAIVGVGKFDAREFHSQSIEHAMKLRVPRKGRIHGNRKR